MDVMEFRYFSYRAYGTVSGASAFEGKLMVGVSFE